MSLTGFLAADRDYDYRGQDPEYYGRFSNNMVSFMNAIRIAILTRKRFVFLPITIYWMRALDIEGWNRLINPTESKCLIHNKPLSVIQYMDDDELSAILHAHSNQWSNGCSIRPIRQLFRLFPHNSTITSIGDNNYLMDYKKFDKVLYSLDLPLLRDTDDERNLEAIRVCCMTDGVIANTEALFYSVDRISVSTTQCLAIPYSSRVVNSARSLHQYISPSNSSVQVVSLCVHVRLEDLSGYTAKWKEYVPHITTFLRKHNTSSSIGRVLIISNGDTDEIENMHVDFPDAVIGCVSLLPDCLDETDTIYPAIEQEACAMADEFIGSVYSTFSMMIGLKRAHRGVSPGSVLIPDNGGELRYIFSQTFPPKLPG